MRWIWPWQDRNRQFSWLKASAFALVLWPGLRFVYQVVAGDFGILAMALGGMVYWSGVWATVVLLAALAVTPVLVILRWPILVDVRRMIGVTGLVYTLAHVLIYFAMRNWNFVTILNDSVARTTMIVAWLSTIGLIVLGVTSLDAVIRAMGARGWQRLHNTNYIITGLAVLHVVLARGTYPEQYALAGAFLWLMGWRGLARFKLGADVRALTALAILSSLSTAVMEAGFLYGRRGFDMPTTFANNFNPVMFEIGVPPTWQVLGLGLLFVFAAAGRQAFVRITAARKMQEGAAAPSESVAA